MNTSCPTATNLGVISDSAVGDAIEAVAVGQRIGPGQSRWYHVFAEDAVLDSFKLFAKVVNVSSGLDVDLHVYKRDPGATCTTAPAVTPRTPADCMHDYASCTASDGCSATQGSVSECVGWFAQCTGILSDDSTEVWVEVRHVTGGCGSFDLKIRNNGDNDGAGFNCASYLGSP